MHTEIVYAKSPSMIDDGCDHTAVIIWNMNAKARARTGSPFVPAPVPVQVMQPKYDRKATTGKKVVKKKPKRWISPLANLPPSCSVKPCLTPPFWPH